MDAAASQPPSRVLILILTWNGRRLTEACLDSVLQLEGPAPDILVVDNASSDDTVTALAARYGDRIRIVRNDKNLLFAGGMNVGLQHAIDAGYEFVLLMNNDVVLDAGMVRELEAALAPEPRVAAAGPKIYYFDQPDRLWFAGGELSLWRGWSHHRGLRQVDRGQYDTPCAVDYLTGCAFLVRTAALRDVGLLDSGYSMYAEDADWCFRARARGWRLVYAPRARLWHRVSASAGARSTFKMQRRAASQWRFLRRHARWYHWIGIPFGTLWEAVRVIGVLLRHRG